MARGYHMGGNNVASVFNGVIYKDGKFGAGWTLSSDSGATTYAQRVGTKFNYDPYWLHAEDGYLELYNLYGSTSRNPNGDVQCARYIKDPIDVTYFSSLEVEYSQANGSHEIATFNISDISGEYYLGLGAYTNKQYHYGLSIGLTTGPSVAIYPGSKYYNSVSKGTAFSYFTTTSDIKFQVYRIEFKK